MIVYTVAMCYIFSLLFIHIQQLEVLTEQSQIKLIRGKAFIDSIPLSRRQQTFLTSGKYRSLIVCHYVSLHRSGISLG